MNKVVEVGRPKKATVSKASTVSIVSTVSIASTASKNHSNSTTTGQ